MNVWTTPNNAKVPKTCALSIPSFNLKSKIANRLYSIPINILVNKRKFKIISIRYLWLGNFFNMIKQRRSVIRRIMAKINIIYRPAYPVKATKNCIQFIKHPTIKFNKILFSCVKLLYSSFMCLFMNFNIIGL